MAKRFLGLVFAFMFALAPSAFGAGTVPLVTGPLDPGALLATLNSLVTSINGALPSSQNGIFVYVSTVAAAGSTVADAGALNQGFNLVTGADATKGVVLPTAPTPGTVIILKNNANAVLKLWPDAAATINAIGSHSDLAMAAYTSAILVATSTTQWFSIPLLPS